MAASLNTSSPKVTECSWSSPCEIKMYFQGNFGPRTVLRQQKQSTNYMTARGKSQRCIAVAGLGKPPFYPAQAGRNPAERAASRPSGAARVAGAAGDGAWRREAHRPSGGRR